MHLHCPACSTSSFLFPPQPSHNGKKYLKETYIILIENTPLWLRMSSLLRLPLASTSVNPLFSWIAFAWIPWIRITLNRFCLNPLNPNFKCCGSTESTYWIRILNAVALPESPESIHLNPNLNAVAESPESLESPESKKLKAQKLKTKKLKLKNSKLKKF